MTAGEIIVIAVFAALFALAVRRIIRRGACCECHGNCGCCGGTSSPLKQPVGKKVIGSVVARRVLVIDGLHCANCVSAVKAALEAIPGVAADVTLDPQRAVVRMDRVVPDEQLREAIEEQGFRVVSVNESVEP